MNESIQDIHLLHRVACLPSVDTSSHANIVRAVQFIADEQRSGATDLRDIVRAARTTQSNAKRHTPQLFQQCVAVHCRMIAAANGITIDEETTRDWNTTINRQSTELAEIYREYSAVIRCPFVFHVDSVCGSDKLACLQQCLNLLSN